MRVSVLGGGVSGLSCALRLRAAGFEVTVASADDVVRTTSWLAAAVWFPTRAGPPELVARCGAVTFGEFARQAAVGVPGVVMRESLALYHEPPPVEPWQAAVTSLRHAREDELPPGYEFGLRFVVPAVEMPIYLPWLAAEVTAAGVQSVSRRFHSVDEVWNVERPDIVVNCAGLAAGELAGDHTVYPVRGQIVRVPNPGLSMSVRDEHHRLGRAYVHPRRDDCILGGTLEVGQWNTEPDVATTESILRRCADLAPMLWDVEPIETLVGLRPGRDAVRLEREDTLRGPVVHNYGHGGAGITLAWGCADIVAALATER